VSGKRIIIHSLADARAALAAAQALKVPVTLVSAEGAGGYAGASWFKALVDAAAAEFSEVVLTAVLDCADEPGTALNALRHGIKHLRFTGAAAPRRRLKDIARELGAEIEIGKAPQALDLLDQPNPEEAALAYLRG
jgi:fructose/tagatose bisphosphate aldolase